MDPAKTAEQTIGPTPYTIFDIPVLKDILRGLAILYLKMIGWRREGSLPDIPKYVLIVAPHTSNWDFPIGLAFAFDLKLRGYWLGKDSLFRWPFHGFVRWLGGIPIDRSRSSDVVAQIVQIFKERKNLTMVVAPEGTRKKVAHWKSGFYHIARGADVPIVLAFIDYLRKAGGIGPVFKPTGIIETDMEFIRSFYEKVTGKYPEKQCIPSFTPAKQ
ncbi:MAG TPA: lysophospholipid acyltransferase family protein [Syntrophales bacterium]|nr:lysophospholipid acyltransferase family protein [Syntrophales bacterium]HOX95562.1 lysophospholipid acyltransferase family protein [Syntrophales bacterium]HPI57461.1 lysophospholipid acyltransferase family protein [Syntrophales bacterium]HPN25682.1 lysophospholipid acyltransferase family protein [Syntrophales bacterium]HQM29486.1 lysophospholipid acyltransferase family protein [Syntrophales bacterium]